MIITQQSWKKKRKNKKKKDMTVNFLRSWVGLALLSF